MSSFLVTPKTISSVTELLVSHVHEFEENHFPRRTYIIDRDRIYSVLLNMNLRALEARYGEAGRFLPDDFKARYVYRPTGDSREARVYRTRCFLYQCDEGDINHSGLFKTLEELAKELAVDIACSLAEKQGVEWG